MALPLCLSLETAGHSPQIVWDLLSGLTTVSESAGSGAQLAVQLTGVVLTRQAEGFREFQNALRARTGAFQSGPAVEVV